MTVKPVFSIIMNCRNAEKYLRKSLESVRDQTFLDYECIVYDNASNDRTIELCEDFDGVKFKLFKHKSSPLSLAEARNRAIAKSSGKFIAFLDSDDIWDKSKLENQWDVMKNHPNGLDEIALCATEARRVSDKGKDLGLFTKPKIFFNSDYKKNMLFDCVFAQSSVVINLSKFRQLGSFNSSYNLCEDWDMWLSLASCGDFVFLPQPLCNITYHQNNSSRNYEKFFHETTEMFNSKLVNASAGYERRLHVALEYNTLRFHIAKFVIVLADRGKMKHIITALFDLTLFCIRHPISAAMICRKYLNFRQIEFFFFKYR